MPRNALYTSPQIQNEIIQAASISLRKYIVDEINKADYLTLLVDGTKDKHGIETLSVAFRYVNEHGNVVERIIGFNIANDQSAEGIFTVLLKMFDDFGIDALRQRLLSQCYDGMCILYYFFYILAYYLCNTSFLLGAAVNAGRLNGLKVKFEKH